MEFLGTRSASFRWNEQFHGIPWNLGCANFDDTSSSIEFHGTRSAPISMTRAVPWNSMELILRQSRLPEQFNGIPWKLECANFADKSSSMEFHKISWNLECANLADTISSMEFHGISSAPISLTRAVPWNSMEFHGPWSAPISLTRAVRWNSMELGVRQFRWDEQFHGITIQISPFTSLGKRHRRCALAC